MMDISSSSNCPSSHESRSGLRSAVKGRVCACQQLTYCRLPTNIVSRRKIATPSLPPHPLLKDFVDGRSGADNDLHMSRLLKGLFTGNFGEASRDSVNQNLEKVPARRKKNRIRKKISSNLQLQEISEAGEKKGGFFSRFNYPRLRARRKRPNQYIVAVIFGISIGLYVFQPVFKEIGEQQRQKIDEGAKLK